MVSKLIRGSLILLVAMGLLFMGNIRVNAMPQTFQTGLLFEQPVDPNGNLILSAWRDPDGSDYDQYIWDDFILPTSGTITEIQWFGGYDPLRSGMGGTVTGFTVSIYPSIVAGTEPAIANPPLVKYQTAGNAGETASVKINGIQVNVYSYTLPTPFVAESGVKYWLSIKASQPSSTPDWGFISATGGSGRHYMKTSGAGGDILYRFAPGDVAFTLLGPAGFPTTSTPASTAIPSYKSIPPVTDTPPAPTSTPIHQQIPTCLGSIFTLMMLMIFFSDFRTRS